MTTKKKILIFIDWFLPAYKAGGPIRSVANMAEYLDKDYQFYIYTGNKDHDGTELTVANNQWVEHNAHTKVYYSSSPSFFEVGSTIKSIQPNSIYINSMFSLAFTIYPLKWNLFLGNKQQRRVIVAPRGMLQAGALQLKATKKRLFLGLMKTSLLKAKNIYWQATDKQELEDIQLNIPHTSNIIEVGNIPSLVAEESAKKSPSDTIRFTTISLVAEKKNHIYFIDLLQRVKANKTIIYDIYGPIKDADYWQQCKEEIKKVAPNVTVNYKGSIEPHKVAETLKQYHYFVLPTLGENFGHAIFEALANGLPVLISDKTPWLNLEEKHAGWSIPLTDKDEWERVVQNIINDKADYQDLSQGAKALAAEYVSEQNFKVGYGELFS
ncbi:glycosyltransferase family 4 protein [Saccharicrinis aurantiacus]|uniref:glycosyltransferase family 4 protein n=1 Tax=Saccharicrinis aurantiacus TaxID=1849719 RepID=UPI00094F76FA|nr:glycosyltransferase family 4 protein [Saccharicrinis aurantiacus]